MTDPHAIRVPVGLLFAAALSVAASGPAHAGDPVRGERIYQVHCASCHGPQGRPDVDGPVVKALGVVPANFSDALFNSREPAADWRLVATHGGPALGFSDRMPAFKDTLAPEDIEDVLAHVKTLGGEHDYPDGDLNLFLPLRTKKAFPEDEVVWKTRYTEDGDIHEWKNTLEFEKRFGTRFQLVLEATHIQDDAGDGKFDMFEPGFKYVLAHDRAAGKILTLGGNVGIPLDGDGSVELLPYLALGRILGEQATFQGSARAKLPVDDIDAGSVELAGIVHWTHTEWPRSVFPGLELVAEFPFERGTGPGRKSVAQVSLVPQARIGLSKRGHVALNAGVELPLNDSGRYDYRAYVFLIWDFADGAFWEGW